MERHDEEWRDASGYEGIYRVSSAGNVMSVEHSLIDSAGRKRHFPAKLLTPTIGKDPRYGYAHLSLTKDGIAKRVWLHRLVAEAFIPNPDNLPQVNHKDGNKVNNNVENLEWCTIRDNLLHSFRTGLHPNEKFEKEAGKRAVIAISPTGEKTRFGSVTDASVFLGYSYPSNLSHDIHKRGGKCKKGYFVYREDGKNK